MSLDFSGLVAGQRMHAVDVLRPWQQTLVQSGYLSDGSDFAGFAKAGAGYGGGDVVPAADLARIIGDATHRFDIGHFRTITLYPGATDGSGDHDAILYKGASLGHADHGIRFASILFANGRYDPVMNVGYNFYPSGTRPNTSEPGFALQWEVDYDDGTFRQCEFYLAYQSVDGTKNSRPIFVQVNRTNGTVTVLLTGGFVNFSGWDGTSVTGSTLTVNRQYVFLEDNSGQPGGAATELHVVGNGRQWALQATNPAGRFGSSELRLPYIDSSDRIYSDGLGAAKVEHAIDNLVLSSGYTPTGSADSAGNTGWLKYDSGFIYVKTGAGAWKRAALSTF